jgi:exodeoxyribonuclease VII large subunit
LVSTDVSILKVSEFNRCARTLLEGNFFGVYIQGEISNFTHHSSGHWYFTLKDDKSQIRCAMFRGQNQKMACYPEAGMEVLVKANASLYEARGDFQLIVQHIEERGEGALQRAFLKLKEKLEKKEMFAKQQPLPRFIRQLGIITSPTGAAIKDILSGLKRRFPLLPVVIYPSLVQGKTASGNLAHMIEVANQRNECDVLLIARGGGSLEDLWAFNEEVLAHAIFESNIPIVSAVGHEIDFTIADFVADHRAATPSTAAELVTPDQVEITDSLAERLANIHLQMIVILKQLSDKIRWTKRHLEAQHPKQKLQQQKQSLDHFEKRLTQAFSHKLKNCQHQLVQLRNRYLHSSPKLNLFQTQLAALSHQLTQAIKQNVSGKNSDLKTAAQQLNTLSPLNTLARGYSITYHKQKPIKNTKTIKPNDQIHIQLIDGSLDCHVDEINSHQQGQPDKQS